MKINETIPRIRAAISAVQVRAAAAVPVMSAAVQVPYIVYNYVLGVFVKFLTRADVVRLFSDTDMSLSKPFADQYTAADFPDVVPNKRLPDGVEAADALSPFQIGKGLFENPKVEEGPYFAEDYTDPGYTIVSIELSFTKPLSESVAAADTLFALGMARTTADTATIADVIAFLRILGPSDTVDALSTTELSTAKSFADQYTVVDIFGATPSKHFSDGADMADVAVVAANLGIVDTVDALSTTELSTAKSFTDQYTVTDILDVVPVKFYSDGAGAVDAVVITANLGIVDAAAIADSGSIRMQDYCDFTYFAEDYVGEARTF